MDSKVRVNQQAIRQAKARQDAATWARIGYTFRTLRGSVASRPQWRAKGE